MLERKIINMKNTIKLGIKAGPSLLASYLCWAIKYSKHPERYPLELRYKKVKKLIHKIDDCASTNLLVYGKENIDENTISCYYSNHYSAYDCILLVKTMNNPISFVVKKEIRKYFMFGRCVRAISGEFMDRDDLRQSLKVMQHVEEDLKNGIKNWAIYPEGTRNKNPENEIGDFHYGSFKAAMRAGVPIVPVAIYGTFRVLNESSKQKFPIQISYLKPLTPEDYKNMTSQEVAIKVREMIEQEVENHLRPVDKQLFKTN